MTELPLVLVRCCTTYAISMRFPIPACSDCDQLPEYLGDAGMTLTFEERAN